MRQEGWCRALAAVGACALVVTMAACGGGGGGGGGGGLPLLPSSPAPEPPASPPPAATGRVVSETVNAKKYGADYRIEVFLPAAYDAGTESLPTIYALDGDATNGLPETRFTNLKNVLLKRGTKAILVGIGGTARRQQDYNFPGADGYHAFLATELVPYLESKYRMDPKRRMLTGLSTSGNLAATALFLEAPDALVFSYFLSFEAAFWQQKDLNFELEQKMFTALAGRSLPVTMVLARCESGCNGPGVREMYDRLAGRNYKDFKLISTLFDATHVGTDVLAFDDAMAKLLP
ncbi:alpha/beta hydrolase [Variovorax sp.]|uniref:alpha/beta hydrolase n=1 Tax=Variovorax sp. TaxID=1871043 RepID=UPI003BA914BE